MTVYSDRDIAQVMRAVIRELQAVNGEQVVPPWDARPEAERAESAERIRRLRERGASPREAHEAWAELRRSEGWEWGPVKDPDARTTPLLAPYEDLDPVQRAKDEMYDAVIRVMTGTYTTAAGQEGGPAGPRGASFSNGPGGPRRPREIPEPLVSSFGFMEGDGGRWAAR